MIIVWCTCVTAVARMFLEVSAFTTGCWPEARPATATTAAVSLYSLWWRTPTNEGLLLLLLTAAAASIGMLWVNAICTGNRTCTCWLVRRICCISAWQWAFWCRGSTGCSCCIWLLFTLERRVLLFRGTLQVDAHVSGNHVPSAGSVGTLWTFVWFFPSVSSLMCVQVVTAAKHLATDTALIRLEPCVQTHMSGQHIATGESTVTHLAIVYFVVVSRAHRLRGEMLGHVFGQVVIRGKHLTTDRTQVRYIRVRQGASFAGILTAPTTTQGTVWVSATSARRSGLGWRQR